MKIKLACALLTLWSSAHAYEFCPSISAIIHQQTDWQMLNFDTDEPLSKSQIEAFKRKVDGFYLAEWCDDYLLPAHCYYTSRGAPLAFGMGKRITEAPGGRHWHAAGPTMQCAASSQTDCVYG